MLEYTKAFLNPFDWAKQAHLHTLGRADDEIVVDPETMTAPTLEQLPTSIDLETRRPWVSWNEATSQQISQIAGLYRSIDAADQYYGSIRGLLLGRLSEADRRLRDIKAGLKTTRTILRSAAASSITLRGGDFSWVDTSEPYYRDHPPLVADTEEGIFRLPDSGSFSSLRSLGGYAGSVEIDASLGALRHTGWVSNIVDGTRTTFWTGIVSVDAPMRGRSVDWLPSAYNHGSAIQLSFYLARPTSVTEIFIDPVAPVPFDLIGVSWTPFGTETTLNHRYIQNPATSLDDWIATGATTIASGYGIDDYAVAVVPPSGYASLEFHVPTWFQTSTQDLETSSASVTTGASGASPHIGTRFELVFSMKSRRAWKAGARVVWLNGSGDVLDYDAVEDYPSGFFSEYRLIDRVPTGAVSGRIDLGLFRETELASPVVSRDAVFFDDVTVQLGEQVWSMVPRRIDGPTTVYLPFPVTTGRMTLTFSQRNPIVRYGEGEKFEYEIGFREIDLRTREFLPRGALVSLPLRTTKEIRRLWVTADVDDDSNAVETFVIPSDDENVRIDLEPFDVSSNPAYSSDAEGQVLSILTPEEVDAGWSQGLSKIYIVEPKPVVETFDGTDIHGKLRLPRPPHYRRVQQYAIESWLKDYGVWSRPYDPNVRTYYGLSDAVQAKADLREKRTPSTITTTDIVSYGGYSPLAVKIQTDRWTAEPDVYGPGEASSVKVVLKETLDETTIVTTKTDVDTKVLGFEEWLNTTSVATLAALLPTRPRIFGDEGNVTLRQMLDSNNKQLWTRLGLGTQARTIPNPRAPVTTGVEGWLRSQSPAAWKESLRRQYDVLKSQQKLGSGGTSIVERILGNKEEAAFKTRHTPLLARGNGTFIRLFWYNGTEYTPIGPQFFTVDAETGVVVVKSPRPDGSDLVADYCYVSDSSGIDSGSVLLELLSLVEDATSIKADEIYRQTSRALPVTRNVTDYVTGRTPVFRRFEPDVLSRDYYPVIEYYVTPDGEIQFSQDFSPYSDVPAVITVEWETLGIEPRVGVGVGRSSPSSSSIVRSVSLGVRESSSSPAGGPL